MTEKLEPVAIKEPELAASAEWVRELEQRILKLESKPEEKRTFVTFDDMEARLAQTHSVAPTAVAARLCPNCGSPAHTKC